MFLVATRLRMHWLDYLERTPDWQHQAYLAWMSLHEWDDFGYKRADPFRFEVGEHVDQETWDRWSGRVAGAKFAMMAREAVPTTAGGPGDPGPVGGEGWEECGADETGQTLWTPKLPALTEDARRAREKAVKDRFRAAREVGPRFEDPTMDPRNRSTGESDE